MILGGMDPVLIGIVVVLLLFVFFVFLFLRRTAKAFKEGYE
jgi:preprotein translocase subunit YajC